MSKRELINKIDEHILRLQAARLPDDRATIWSRIKQLRAKLDALIEADAQ